MSIDGRTELAQRDYDMLRATDRFLEELGWESQKSWLPGALFDSPCPTNIRDNFIVKSECLSK